MTSNYSLHLRSVQSSSIKILFEALKELLMDCTIDFDETGMKILCMDNSHIVLCHLKLDANKFEFYECPNKISIGVNMLNLYKLIRTINSNDTLTLFIEESDINHLGIKIENGEKNSKTTYKLNLLDLDNNTPNIDPAEFNSVITLPSVDFQKICRDMNNIADYIEITSVNNQLVFKCKGDFCSQETILCDNNNGVHKIQNENADEIIQGIFSLKYLVLFTRSTNLSSSVELFIKNNYPLVLRYQVASLGELKLCLSPNTNMTA